MKEYYNQADNRWANHLYTSPTHPQANLKTSGCGPTSAAMIVTNMVKRILPNEMADIFKNNGYRANAPYTVNQIFLFLFLFYNKNMLDI